VQYRVFHSVGCRPQGSRCRAGRSFLGGASPKGINVVTASDAAPLGSVMNARRFAAGTSRAFDRKDSTHLKLREGTTALRDFGPAYVRSGVMTGKAHGEQMFWGAEAPSTKSVFEPRELLSADGRVRRGANRGWPAARDS
jgi:hypothetical protein